MKSIKLILSAFIIFCFINQVSATEKVVTINSRHQLSAQIDKMFKYFSPPKSGDVTVYFRINKEKNVAIIRTKGDDELVTIVKNKLATQKIELDPVIGSEVFKVTVKFRLIE